ncbi:MAG TPA: heat-inducible transcriptional repressor HrcA [Candidatus Micrarchaeia archaeon]|nr:heat-inducible transcriptional repressor HrcA [Candidatus Micrarchaeia archaeon]
MDARKERILQAVVADYTETMVPVGSQTLAARYLSEISSATIRNELAELVVDGFLLQPHTSAGRIPTDRGYRYFVDFLLPAEPVEPHLRRSVRHAFESAPPVAEAILDVAAAMMSRLSENLAVLTGPTGTGSRLKHVALVGLRAGQALLVVAVADNLVRQRLIAVDEADDQDALTTVAGWFNRHAVGRSAEELAALPRAADEPRPARAILAEVAAALRSLDAPGTVIIHDGVRNLVSQPEFGDPQQLHAVLEVLETQRMLAELLSLAMPNRGVQAVIGSENALQELRGCAFLVTAYRVGDRMRGTIGVVGPTRLRYGRVVARMELVSRLTGEMLDRYVV